MAPVEWLESGWCVINPDFEEVQYSYPISIKSSQHGSLPLSGNFKLFDDFNDSKLKKNWTFLRNPVENWYTLKGGSFSMKILPQTCSGTENPGFLGHRQQHLRASASTQMHFTPKNEKEKAGLLIFQNETHYYFLCKSVEAGIPEVQLWQANEHEMSKIQSQKTNGLTAAVQLKIEAKGDRYDFYYAGEEGGWILLQEGLDATFLSTKTAGGFVGSMFALYGTSSGEESENVAVFDWFEYEGNDEVYR